MRSSAPRNSTRVRNNPDLTAMPMCCIPFSFKDPFDTKDMRSTAAADARYDIDFPARDHTLVAQLRRTGAIIYAKAVNTEYGTASPPTQAGGTAREDHRLRPRVSAQQLVRQPAQRLRLDARGVARLELGLGRVGERQPRDVQCLRGDQHVVSRSREPQLRGAAAAA